MIFIPFIENLTYENMNRLKIVASEVGGSLQASIPTEAWPHLQKFWRPSEVMFSFLASKGNLGELFADLDKFTISEAVGQAVCTLLAQSSPGTHPKVSATTIFYPLFRPSNPEIYTMGNYATEVTMTSHEATTLRNHLLAPAKLPSLLIHYPGLEPIPTILHSRLHPHPNNAYHLIAFDPMDAGLDPHIFEHIDVGPTFGDVAWRGYITPSLTVLCMDNLNAPEVPIPKCMRDQVKPSAVIYLTSAPGPMRFHTAPKKYLRLALSASPQAEQPPTNPSEFNIPMHKLLTRASLSKPDITRLAWARVAATRPPAPVSNRKPKPPSDPTWQRQTTGARKRNKSSPDPLEQRFHAMLTRVNAGTEHARATPKPPSSTPNGIQASTPTQNMPTNVLAPREPPVTQPGASSIPPPSEAPPPSELPIPIDPEGFADDPVMSRPSPQDLQNPHNSDVHPAQPDRDTCNPEIPLTQAMG